MHHHYARSKTQNLTSACKAVSRSPLISRNMDTIGTESKGRGAILKRIVNPSGTGIITDDGKLFATDAFEDPPEGGVTTVNGIKGFSPNKTPDSSDITSTGKGRAARCTFGNGVDITTGGARVTLLSSHEGNDVETEPMLSLTSKGKGTSPGVTYNTKKKRGVS